MLESLCHSGVESLSLEMCDISVPDLQTQIPLLLKNSQTLRSFQLRKVDLNLANLTTLLAAIGQSPTLSSIRLLNLKSDLTSVEAYMQLHAAIMAIFATKLLSRLIIDCVKLPTVGKPTDELLELKRTVITDVKNRLQIDQFRI